MKKKKPENNKILAWIYFIVLTIAILFLLFNNFGIVKYFFLNSEVHSIEKKIEQTDMEIKKYNKNINSLKNNDEKLEEVAREKFHMKKKNEKAFQFKDKKER